MSSEDDTNFYELDNYHLISKGHSCSRHGGLIIYVHNDFSFTLKQVDPIINNNEQVIPMWEHLFISIKHKLPNSKTYIIGNIYRRPIEIVDSCNTFTEELTDMLIRLQRRSPNIYVVGDINIDLLKIYQKHHYASFFENMISTGFYPKISLPTRFDSNNSTATLIDNIFTNVLGDTSSGAFTNSISDHQMIYYFSNDVTCSTDKNKNKFVVIESSNTVNLSLFLDALKEINIPEKLNQNPFANPDKNYELFTDILSDAKQRILPRKKVKFNKRKHKKSPWITRDIIHSINEKDKLYRKLLKTPQGSQEFNNIKTNFKTYKSIIRRSIMHAKKEYYRKTFHKYSNDLKKTWKIINDTLNRNSNKKSFPSEFISSDGNTICDHNAIANAFNDFFINIGQPSTNIEALSYEKYLDNKTYYNFRFRPITTAATMQIIDSLKPKTSNGVDEISNKLIKYIKDVVIEPLTIIINQMFNTGIFPDLLKISKVIPIYKKDDDKCFANYRPISLLPSMSKIFEKAILLQLIDYLESNKLLNPYQYGFRKKHSTELASLHLVDYLSSELDNMNTPLNIYLDLSKAFDSLNHNILLSKLEYYGITGISHNLFNTYLSNRKQYVQYESSHSDLANIKYGVPQGSILGPLLFLIYINDLPKSSKIFSFLMYADDTTLYCNIDNINPNYRDLVINAELQNINNWLVANKLSLNVSKTKYMIFYKKPKCIPDLHLSIDSNEIERVESFNFLGLHINTHLTWNTHLSVISKKNSRIIGLIRKMKSIFPFNIVLSLYNTLILPHINYCLLSWGKNCESILLLQKRALRAVFSAGFNAHTEPLFKICKLLKIEDIYKTKVFSFYHNLKQNKLPDYFTNFNPVFSNGNSIYSFRNPKFLSLTFSHEYVKFTLRYQLPVLLNHYSVHENRNNKEIRDICNILTNIDNIPLHVFKSRMKSLLLSEYSYICILSDCYVCNS